MIVGHGMPAVKSRSVSSSGVVTNLALILAHTLHQSFTFIASLPVDVSNVKDLAVTAHQSTDLGVTADEFDRDGSLAETGAHGEVCNGGHEGDGGGNVMEDTVTTRLGEGQAHEGERGGRHDGTYCPVPITSTNSAVQQLVSPSTQTVRWDGCSLHGDG